jgi:O-acetyl-ADP-ribose deacetylase (regulator of RNase III)
MSESMKIHNSTIGVLKEDITLLEVQAFVFYASHDLKLGSGFGTAISMRGGSSIQEELDALAPVETTQVVITGAGKLPSDFILHAVGPRFQEENLEQKLRTTVLECLRQAESRGITRLAFPAMGTGFYGVPLALSAETTICAIRDYLRQDTKLRSVVICVLDSREYGPFTEQLAFQENPSGSA